MNAIAPFLVFFCVMILCMVVSFVIDVFKSMRDYFQRNREAVLSGQRLKRNPYQEAYKDVDFGERQQSKPENYQAEPDWEDHFRPANLDDNLRE